MSLAESLFHSLADPNVAFLLLNLGFLAIVVWIFHPGFHVSLAVGIIIFKSFGPQRLFARSSYKRR